MSTTKECTKAECGKSFKLISQETDFYERKELPLPDLCPSCRHKQRMALRSERELYSRECSACGEKVLSTIPDSAPYKISCQKCFWENIG